MINIIEKQNTSEKPHTTRTTMNDFFSDPSFESLYTNCLFIMTDLYKFGAPLHYFRIMIQVETAVDEIRER